MHNYLGTGIWLKLGLIFDVSRKFWKVNTKFDVNLLNEIAHFHFGSKNDNL